MKQRFKRPLALLLTVAMLLGMLPAAFAAGGEDQPPADSGDLSSGATLLTGEEPYFGTLTLTGFNEAASNTAYSSVTKNLLELEADTPLKWHLGSTGTRYPATMSLNAGSGEVQDGADRTLTIELKKGLEFVSYPKDSTLPAGVTLAEEPAEDETIKNQYGYSSVYGKLVYALSDRADVNGFRLDNIIIQPTRAFFDESETGMEIEDALQVTYTADYGDESKNVSETKSFDVELWGALKTNGIHPYSNKYSYVLAPGESTQNRLCLWTMENALNGQLIKKITYTIEADEELIFSEPSISATNGAKEVTMTDSTSSDGKKTVVFSSSDLQIGETASISGSSFISYNLDFEYQVSVDANTTPGVYTYVIKSAVVELESGTTLTFSDKNDISFTVQERLDDGSDANFAVQDSAIQRANTNQTDINMTMSGLVWENIGVNATLPKTVEIQFDNDAVINVVMLLNNSGITDNTVAATLRMADGSLKAVSKSRDDFADPTQITLAEFGETGAVSIQSLTAQVGQLAASARPLATNAWTVRNDVRATASVFPAYGHFADAETASTTTTYTIWNTGYGKDAADSNTKTATCTASASQETNINFSATSSSISSFPSSLENGDVLSMDVLFQQYYASATDSAPLVQPVVYLRQPKDMAFSRTSLRLYDRVNGSSSTETQINPVSITDVTRSCDVNDGSSIWQIVLPEDYILGYYDENMSHHGLRIQYDLTVLPNAASASIDQASMIFLTNLDGISATNAGGMKASDIYNVTGKGTSTQLCGLSPQICTLKGSDQISMGSAIKTDLDDSYFNYVEGDTSTIASFAAGQTGSIQLNVVNNGSTAATDAVFYISLPKPDADYSALFGGEDAGTLNLYLTKQGGEYFASTGTAPSVSYAKVTGYDDESGLPLANTGWGAGYSDNCNMIRVEYKDGIQPGSESTLTFYVKTSDSAGDSGKISVFYPAVDCTYGSVTQRGAQAPIAIQCWNGEVSGTVFDDADRDGVQDAGEGGLAGISVEVKPENAPSKFATTGADGTYKVTGVRTDGPVTVTIRDTTHTFSSTFGAEARQYSMPVENPPSDGSAYSVVTVVEGTPSSAAYTYAANTTSAVVSAGLIKPYEVTFNGTGNTTVNPSVIYRFPSETVGEHKQKVSVSTGAGESFQDQWYMSVGGAASTTVEDSALLATEITGDTTFAPVIESEVNAVYFMVWDKDEEKMVPLSYEVEYNKTLADKIGTFPSLANHQKPGHTLTAWNVGGVGLEFINNDLTGQSEILNKRVTGMTVYVAVYTEKSDIKVTLDLNYEGAAEATVLENQTYGATIEYTPPTREGYTFQGWSTERGAATGSMSLTCPTEDTTYYAVWKPGTVRLTLMENGGTWTADTYKNGYIDGTVGENVNLPTAADITREGYGFQGWYVQGDAEQTLLNDDYKFPATATTLIAKWEPKQESITFDYGDGSGITPQTVTVSGAHGTAVGNDEAENLLNVTRTGWSLTGWKNEATGIVTPAANTGSILIEEGQKYIAQWAQGQSKLSFDAGEDAEFPNNGQVKVYYGNTGSTLEHGEPVDPIREGYRFLGWFEATSGGTAVTEFVFPQTENEEKTYHAQWEIETYTVTFRFNGGTLDGNNYKEVSVAYRGKVSVVPAPTYGDAKLQNWTDVATGQTYSSDAIEAREVKGNVIYSANWDLPSYQVTFGNLGGNADSTSTISVTSGNGVFPPDPQTPEGKVFLHWLLTSDPAATKTEYSDQELAALKISENMTFQAVFGEDSYTITFITTDGTLGDTGNTSLTLQKDGKDTLSAGDFPEVKNASAAFKGWFYGGETKSAQAWDGTVVAGNMQFVAAFEGNVTLHLIANNGTFAQGAQTTFTGAAGTPISIPTPARTGWTFAGWYDAPVGGNRITDTDSLPATSTVWYAQWTSEKLDVTVQETPTYDGTAQTPALTVTSGTTALNTDQYVAVYSNNIDAGTDTAKVTVYGRGDYLGLTGYAAFTINKADQTVTFVKGTENQTATYGESFSNPATAKLDSAAATITYSSGDTSVAAVDAATGEVTILKAGTVIITATAAATDNVKEGKAEYKLTISKASPVLRFDNAAVSVKTTGKVENKLHVEPSDLTVTYTSSNASIAEVDANTGEVTLKGGEGKATITATFAGNDQYNEATASYTLTVDNDAIAYTAEGWYGTYDGQDHKITVKVTQPNSNYTVTYSTDGQNYSSNPITRTDAGEYPVYYKIEANGYDTVTGSAKIIIVKAALTEATVTGGEYTGSPVNATVSGVKAGALEVTANDYTVTCRNNINAGTDTATVTITAKPDSNFTGTLVKSFTISPKTLSEAMVSSISDQPYAGQQIKPTVIVMDGTTELVAGRDYTVTYGDNNTVGSNAGTVTITGKGNYKGTVTRNFNITNSGTFEVVVDNKTLTYAGNKKEPAVTVWAVSDGGKTKRQLTESTDYTLTYGDNTDAGTASVTVTGKSDSAYENWQAATAYFTIGKAEQIVFFAGVTGNAVTKTYGDPAFDETASVKLNPDVSGQQTGAVTYTTSDATVATVDSDGKVTIVGTGTATITATAAATDNYNGASASYTLTVAPKDIGSGDVTVSKIADQPYEGLAVKPDFTVIDSGANIPKKNLLQNVDYTVEYTDNDKIGTGKIILTGTGNYTGTKEVTFQIVSLQAFTITVAPAPITIYMGGQEGFDQVVVDEDTGAIQASKSLPVPGFLFTLPDALTEALEADGKTAADLIFQERGGDKQWTVEKYNESAQNLYRLVPKEAGQDPVRVQFTNAEGQTVREDHFTVGENVNQELTMSIYRGQVGDIVVIYNNVRYPVRTGESKLTVRGTTSAPQLPAVTTEENLTLEAGKAAVTAPAGTTYTINGGDVQVTDTTGVSLLFDGIINSSGNDRTEQLEARAEAYFNDPDAPQPPAEGCQYAYSFQYLDLVDVNNGNAWVKASKDVTVYWPIPAGADETSLKVLHFKGLHRDMATGEIEGEINKCEVETVSRNVQDGYVTFDIGSAGFSPFALVWQTRIPYTIKAAAGSGGAITPSGSATVLHGDSQTFTITPASGYRISDVLVDGASVGAVSTYTFDNVTANHTIGVSFQSIGGGGGGGGGGGTAGYTIKAEAGDGGAVSPSGNVRVTSGSDKTFTITAEDGYIISDVLVDGGSVGAVSKYTFENVRKNHTIEAVFAKGSPIADPDDTGVSGWLNTTDHLAFLNGYEDGTFGPNQNMTRAETAQMFYNLLLHKDVPVTVSFTDVPADAWCAEAVNTLASMGILQGVGKHQFAPDRAITRAEFTVIAMRFADLDTGGENIFSDVNADDWFYAQVIGSIRYGWINGYEDGTFRPNNTITRAEVTAIVNRMLGRAADEDYVDRHADALRQFPDVSRTHWAYYQIMEAANAHDYNKENGAEDWNGLK